MNTSEAAIDDFLIGVLLRYFRAGVAVVPGAEAGVRRLDDLDHVRMRWAVSAPVRALVRRLVSHPHELRSVLVTSPRTEDGRVRGRLDARATLVRRLVTGHPTLTVGHEPVRNSASGPNHVLLWVLGAARRGAAHFAALAPPGSPQRPQAVEVSGELEAVARSAHVRAASMAYRDGRRPGAAAVAEASRSRLPLYVAAAEAYKILLKAEAGDPEALRTVLADTLVGPTEAWRRFELAVALAAAEALGEASGTKPALGLLAGGDRLVARVGRFSVHWQSLTKAYRAPLPEPSEVAVAAVLDAYGFRASSDRPDVVVLDDESGGAVAVLEAKFFASGDGADAFRDAVSQIVRYARGYRGPGSLDGLLGMSVVALVDLGDLAPLPAPHPPSVPWLVDLVGLTRQGLRNWAARCVAASASAGAAERTSAAPA